MTRPGLTPTALETTLSGVKEAVAAGLGLRLEGFDALSLRFGPLPALAQELDRAFSQRRPMVSMHASSLRRVGERVTSVRIHESSRSHPPAPHRRPTRARHNPRSTGGSTEYSAPIRPPSFPPEQRKHARRVRAWCTPRSPCSSIPAKSCELHACEECLACSEPSCSCRRACTETGALSSP